MRGSPGWAMARRNGNRCTLRTAFLVACGTGLLVVVFNLVQMHHLVGRQSARADRQGVPAQMLGGTQDASDPVPRFGAGDAADEALAQVVIVALSYKIWRASGYSLSLCLRVRDGPPRPVPPSLPPSFDGLCAVVLSPARCPIRARVGVIPGFAPTPLLRAPL